MKVIFEKYKAGFITSAIIFVLLLGFTITRYITGMGAVTNAVNEKMQVISLEKIDDAGWNIPEIQQKKKEINWVERQLLLAKSDSLNLGISLHDSIVQVQLKGTVLLQAKVLKQYPASFFESLNFGAYHDFTKISSIVGESSTIPKRPVKKVQAPKNENEVTDVKHDTIPDPTLMWQFKLDNHIEVIITGVGFDKDSLINVNFKNDILKYSLNLSDKNWLPETYIPKLYLWLNDKDAKAIYRAIPEKGKVVFSNL